MSKAQVRPRLTQQQRTQRSDKRMREAAIQLLLERGITGMTLAAIGEKAGYSRGLATHRFGSKSNLLAFVHDHAVSNWISRVQQAVGQRGGYEALECVVDALYGFILEEPDEIRAMYLLRYSSIDPSAEFRGSVSKALRAQHRDVQRWVEAGQADGSVDKRIDANLAAELFCAAIDGLIYRWLIAPELSMRALHDLLKLQIGKAFSVT